MTTLHLSRVRLRSRRGEALASIAPLLIPRDPKQAPGVAHRVLWMLFQDRPDSTRDFLWRDEGDGRYMILSRRAPSDPHGFFEVETKSFEPALVPGDRLRFAMRVNPIVASKAALGEHAEKGARGKRVDVIMRELYAIPATVREGTTGRAISGRAFERDRVVTEASAGWMTRQLEKSGAELQPEAFSATNYRQVPLDRRSGGPRGGRPAGFSTVDLEGVLTVREPQAFLDRLAHGYGAAKAFGCGLMLIRRAS